MKKLQLAIWSVGQHAIRNILPAIIKSDLVHLNGIHTRNQTVLNEQSKIYQSKAYSTKEEMLSNQEIDAIYLSSPNSLHYSQTKDVLNSEKHVLVEKSAFLNSNETKKIVALAKKKKLLVMEAFMYKYHHQFKCLQEIIYSKKYGQILYIESSFGIPHLDSKNIRYSNSLGGGALYDVGAYCISSITHLLNKANLEFSNINHPSNYEVDISGLAVFKQKDTLGIAKWAFGGSYTNSITVWCEKGIIKINRAFSKPAEYREPILVMNNNQIIEEIKINDDNHFINMFNHFATTTKNIETYEKEHISILKQAKYLNQIRNYTNA